MDLGGSFTLPGTSMTLNRMGYGAMQLAGPQVWGPPRDVDGALLLCERRLRSARILIRPR
jgi:pyridoxine 4-dehydrogenase